MGRSKTPPDRPDPKASAPPPWSVDDIGAAFVVKDSTGQQLAYVYFEDEPGRANQLLNRACQGCHRAS